MAANEEASKDAKGAGTVTDSARGNIEDQSGGSMEMGKRGESAPSEHVNADQPSSRLQGIGAGMTADFDPAHYPRGLLAQYWYAKLKEAA